jgi:outer membrane protein
MFSTIRLVGAVVGLTMLFAGHQLQAQGSATPRTLSLEEALALAGASSEAVGLAEAGVLRSRGQQYQARSQLLPQVNTSLNYSRQLQNQFQAITERFSTGGADTMGGGGGDAAENPITRIFASPYTVTFALQASQPIFTGGRARAGIAAARYGRQSADLGITAAQAQAQLDITQAYYDAVLADRLVEIAESTLIQAERTLRQVQLTFDVGNTSEFELIRASVTRDNQRPAYLQARTQRDLAKLRLKQLLDLPLDEPLTLTSPIQEAPANGPAQRVASTSLTVSREDVIGADPRVQAGMDAAVAEADTAVGARLPVRQAELGVQSATQQLKSTKGQRWPQVSLTTTYQRFAYPDDGVVRSFNDFFPNWTVGLGVSLPLFTGGRVKGEVMAAEAGVAEARLRLQQTREAAQFDVQQALMGMEQAQSAWLASVGTADQAQRGYDIAEVRYREGISTQVELSETRVQLQQALANRAQAARDLQVARVRLTLLRDLPLATAGAAAGGAAAGGAAAGAGAAQAGATGGAQTGAAGAGVNPGGGGPFQ